MNESPKSQAEAHSGLFGVRGTSAAPLSIYPAKIDEHCVGKRWVTVDLDHVARIVAIVAMGQAVHVARIITELLPAAPALNKAALRTDARRALSVRGKNAAARDASRWQRDGLIFETISWLAARQEAVGTVVLRDPHLSSTTQGLDGLMLELDDARSAVIRSTILEDKCSEDPRGAFRDKIMPAFKQHHAGKRAADLLATGAALLEKSGLHGDQAVAAAGRVLDRRRRVYRGSLAVTTADDSRARRQHLFKGYEALKDIKPAQRVGATFVTSDDLRAWFDELAARAIAYLDALGIEDQ